MVTAGIMDFVIGCICCINSLMKACIRDSKNKVIHYTLDFAKKVYLKEKKHK